MSSSSGTPVGGGGFMRQRYSSGYISDGEDLEDDACSRASTYSSGPATYRAQTWTQVAENVLWIASAVFIVYFGDRRSNLISLLLWDGRIKRTALRLGLASICLNSGVILCMTYSARNSARYSDKHTVLRSAAPLITVIGLISFCLVSSALWPIWGFLTIPLLFTLVMAFMVISPYLPIGPIKPQSLVLHTV